MFTLVRNEVQLDAKLVFTLSAKYAQKESQELLTAVKEVSIVTWKHINFHGEYDFSEEKLRDSVGLNLPQILSWKRDENQE